MWQSFSPKDFRRPVRKSRLGLKNWDWNKIFKYLGILAIAGFVFVLGVFAWAWKDLPSPGSVSNRKIIESTKIYDRTGNHLLYDIHGEEKRTQIDFAQMPDTIKYATISLEDQDFYTHHGIKITSMFRSALVDIFHRGAKQGASTITQQLIKNSILTSERTLTRKIKEVILALELEQKFSKNDILGMYLNEIPYGSNAYGIEAASQTFFGKHANDLTLDEAALLSALPQAPSYYSPYGNHTDALIGRQMYALNQMAKLGYITQEQADEAKGVDVLSKIKAPSENISAPHFVMYVKEYLENKYGEQAVEQGGLKVYTTLDWDKQQAAEKAVKEGAANNAKYNASNAALVAMDPKTGQILAMVGSKDYFDKSIDGQVNVAIRDRQPGSSFKPYVYLTAFSKGYTPETNIWDVDTNFSTEDGKTYDPKNYDGKNSGLMQMKDTLARSLNVPAVKALYLAGIKDSISTAHQMGITTLNKPDDYGLSLVLGGGEVKLLDHVNAYGTFATGGIHHDKTAILKVEDSKGKVLEQYKNNQGNRVIDEKYISMIDYILSTNSLRAPVFGDNNPLSFPNRPVAAKTGTTNEWRDGWTMGYTPSLVAGVWAGNNNNTPLKAGSDGIYVAAPIWRAFMNAALQNSHVEDFPKYEAETTGKDALDGKLNVKKEIKVCKISSKKYCIPDGSSCPNGKDRVKKKFTDAHSILYYVNRNDPRGDTPKNPKDDPQFENWDSAVKNWLKSNGYSTSSTPDSCDGSSSDDEGKPSVQINSPEDGDTITSSSLGIKADTSSKDDISKVSLSINGLTVKSSEDKSFEYTYIVPSSEKHSSLEISVKATDTNGDSDTDTITVNTDIND